jgi:hypothetical protein
LHEPRISKETSVVYATTGIGSANTATPTFVIQREGRLTEKRKWS